MLSIPFLCKRTKRSPESKMENEATKSGERKQEEHIDEEKLKGVKTDAPIRTKVLKQVTSLQNKVIHLPLGVILFKNCLNLKQQQELLDTCMKVRIHFQEFESNH